MILSNANRSVGGTEKQALSLANELALKGVAVSFLSKRLASNKLKTPLGSGNNAEEKALEGVEVTYLPILRLQPGWSFLCSFLGWALVHRRDFQIIHAHNPALGVIACIVGWALDKKVVVKLPSNRAVSYLRGGAPLRQLRRWILLRKVTRFVSVSTEMMQSLQRMGVGADRITWIPNGVEYMSTSHCHDRRALKIELLDNADKQVVLFVGRLVEEKGLERLLKAWAAMPYHENAILCLVGNGPLRNELEAVAARLDVLSSVRFLGHQPHVSKFYAIADLFVLPSHTEGMSNALLEAMAAGLPVVASDVGGNKDVIDDQVSGFLVNWDDTMLCGQVLSALLAEPHLCRTIGDVAKERARDFALSQIAEQYRDLYQAIVRG